MSARPERPRLGETCLAGLDLSLWSGAGAGISGEARALEWEREMGERLPPVVIGAVFTFGPNQLAAARSLIASLACAGGKNFRAVLRFPSGDPDPFDLDPCRETNISCADGVGLLKKYGLDGRVAVVGNHSPKEILTGLAADCDFVGVAEPGTWVQPRGVLLLSRFLGRRRPDLLAAGAVVFSPDDGRRLVVSRVPVAPRYEALGSNPYGSCPLLRAERVASALEVIEELGDDWLSRPWASWAFGLAGAVDSQCSPERLPLAPWAVYSGDGGIESAKGDAFPRFMRHCASKLGADLDNWHLHADGHGLSGRPVPRREDPEMVGVLVPFRDEEESTGRTLENLAGQTLAARLFIVLVDNGSVAGVLDRLRTKAERLFGGARVATVRVDEPFNFARLNNRALRELPETCKILLLANNDIEFADREGLSMLCAPLSWPDVALSGGRLVYPDGTIQGAGIRFGPAGPQAIRTPGEGVDRFREVDAVGFACAVCRREAFEQVGGLDEEHCPNGFGDALFCHRLRRSGWRILCLPEVVVRHHESKTRGARPEEFEYFEMASEGLAAGLFHEDFAVETSVRNEVRSRPRAPFAKRIYRSFRAFFREWRG